MRSIIIAFALLALTACGQQEVEEGEHVWKDQVQTMDKAREVENTLKDAEKRRRDKEEEQLN